MANLSAILLIVLFCGAVVGCADSTTPAPSDLLENLPFAAGIDGCSRHDEPMSASQLTAFVGNPDLTLPWAQVRQVLSSRAGIDGATVEAAIGHMRDKYAINKGVAKTPAPDAPAMEHVDVWIYKWNDPAKLDVSDLFHSPAGRMSILVLVEKGRVVGTTDISFQ